MSVPSHSLAESALGVGPAGTQAAMGPLPASLFSWFPSAVCAHCQTPTWWGSTLKASTLSLSPRVCSSRIALLRQRRTAVSTVEGHSEALRSATPVPRAPVLPGGGRPESSSQLPLPGPLRGSGVGLTRHLPVTLSLWPVPLGQLPPPIPPTRYPVLLLPPWPWGQLVWGLGSQGLSSSICGETM